MSRHLVMKELTDLLTTLHFCFKLKTQVYRLNYASTKGQFRHLETHLKEQHSTKSKFPTT